jgi:hypothetical protein
VSRFQRSRRPQIGALPPRYSFVLNPYPRERFTRCPRCEAQTRVRKIPLVIHIDPAGLIMLRKACRLCVVCEVLVAHQAEVEQLIDANVQPKTDNTWFSALSEQRLGVAVSAAVSRLRSWLITWRASRTTCESTTRHEAGIDLMKPPADARASQLQRRHGVTR